MTSYFAVFKDAVNELKEDVVAGYQDIQEEKDNRKPVKHDGFEAGSEELRPVYSRESATLTRGSLFARPSSSKREKVRTRSRSTDAAAHNAMSDAKASQAHKSRASSAQRGQQMETGNGSAHRDRDGDAYAPRGSVISRHGTNSGFRSPASDLYTPLEWAGTADSSARDQRNVQTEKARSPAEGKKGHSSPSRGAQQEGHGREHSSHPSKSDGGRRGLSKEGSQKFKEALQPNIADYIRKNPTALVKDGYLWKQGALNKGWRQRYFTLHPYTIRYYDSPGAPLKGEIQLQGVSPLSVEVSPNLDIDLGRGQKASALLTIPSGGTTRTFYLAGSEWDVLEWETAIKATCSASTGGAAPRSPAKREEKSSSQQQSDETSFKFVTEGYLWKKGEFVQNWKRRFFILSKNALRYYESKETCSGEIYLGEISFRGLSSEMVEVLPKEPSRVTLQLPGPPEDRRFAIQTAKRRYILAAETQQDVRNWVESLKAAIEAYNHGSGRKGWLGTIRHHVAGA